jgi:hypothetical protein
MLVVSSDLPHFEGYANPNAEYTDLLAQIGETRRALVMGGSTASLFERVGGPLARPQ